jgi:hypothetical protein
MVRHPAKLEIRAIQDSGLAVAVYPESLMRPDSYPSCRRAAPTVAALSAVVSGSPRRPSGFQVTADTWC